MGKILKAVIFGGKARVAVLDTTDTVNEAIRLHKLSPWRSPLWEKGAYGQAPIFRPTSKTPPTVSALR